MVATTMRSTKLKLCAGCLCILSVLLAAACQSNESGTPSLDPTIETMHEACLNSSALAMVEVPEGMEDEFCDCVVEATVEILGTEDDLSVEAVFDILRAEGDIPETAVVAAVRALMECVGKLGE